MKNYKLNLLCVDDFKMILKNLLCANSIFENTWVVLSFIDIIHFVWETYT